MTRSRNAPVIGHRRRLPTLAAARPATLYSIAQATWELSAGPGVRAMPQDKSNENLRRDVLFHGRVQGVGFRYTARHIAGRFRVTGYVQNLPDGRVRLVAEGTKAEVDRFLAALATEMADYIHGQDEETGPATGEFAGFEVKTVSRMIMSK